MESQKFDALVLGAGPGGYVAAIRLAQLGKSVAIVEEKYWGGVCLNVGCIPSKALLNSAGMAHSIKQRADEFGIAEITPNYELAFNRSREVSEGRVKGIHYLMRKNKIQEFEGRGSFTDLNHLEVNTKDGPLSIEFDYAIIATGASVRQLGQVPFSEGVVSYEEQILESETPESISIIGAGPIGVEFSFILANFGTKVELIEYQDRVLPLEEPEVSKEIAKSLQSLGIVLRTSSAVEDITESSSGVEISVKNQAGENETIKSSKAMVSIGFKPNLFGFGLENLDVELDGEAIKVDKHLRTNQKNIFAIGDVTGKMQLAHVAEAQAIVAAEAIAGLSPEPIEDYRFMPRAVFSEPQVASFGLREQEAVDAGMEIQVSKFPMMANGKANALGKPSGFIKLIMNKKDDTLVGAHMVGADVSELLAELTLAHSTGLKVSELASNVHIHPTLSESIQEAVHGLAGEMINF